MLFERTIMMYKEKILKLLKSPALADIWRWSKAVHKSIFILCVLNLMICGCSLGITVATRGLIDSAAGRDSGQLKLYAGALVVLVVMIRCLSLGLGLLNTKTNALLLKEMRSMILKSLLGKQYAGLNGYHSGELVNRMFSDVNVVKNGIVEVVPGVVGMGVSFLGAAAILIAMDWRFVVVLVLGGMLGLLLLILFRKPMKQRHKEVQEKEGQLHAMLQETLENLRLIKASGSEKRIEYQMDVRQQHFQEAQMRKGAFSVYMNNSINLIFQFGWLFCMLWGGFGIYRGNLTYGMLAAIIQLVGQIQKPIASAAGVVGQVYGTISSAERLKEILDLPEEENGVCADGRELYKDFSAIQMRNLCFSYGKDRQPVLEQVNIRIGKGDFVAVTGISGGGKSTLFQLLLGIYQPSSGQLGFCFDNGTEEMPSRMMRSLFAYVPQGNTLFSGTLRENFTMFTDDATDEEILQAAKAACIERLIVKSDAGLDTVIGERGIGLSEGQAQRVAVARALLSRAPILLLDESTSALDEETEAKLLGNIASLKEKTCLIVTHRKAALKICDYRIHIENGGVKRMEIYGRDRKL